MPLHAAAFGMAAVLVNDVPDDTDGTDHWASSADQIIVTKHARLRADATMADFCHVAIGGYTPVMNS